MTLELRWFVYPSVLTVSKMLDKTVVSSFKLFKTEANVVRALTIYVVPFSFPSADNV